VFPCQVMSFPYLLFASDIGKIWKPLWISKVDDLSLATGLLRIIYESKQSRVKKWSLIHWSIASALYYLLSLLIVTRIVYQRRIIGREFGKSEVRHFTSCLTIFHESGAVVLAFSTAYLVVLARFHSLINLLQSTTLQIQASSSSWIISSVMVMDSLRSCFRWSSYSVSP